MRKLVAQIDDGACLAHGDCADIAPDAFSVNGTAVVIGSASPEAMLAAAEACPAAAISLYDSETGEPVYP